MFCQKCGAEIKNGDAFCSNCGAKVEAAPSVSAKAESSSVTGVKQGNLSFLAGLAPQALVTLAGLAVGLIACFLPYKSYYESGFIATMQGVAPTSTDKTLLQEGGIALIVLIVLTGFFLLKQKRVPYRIFAIITGIMSFVLWATADQGTGARYSNASPLIGSKVVLVAALMIIVGVVMDFVRSKKKAD